jgi:hypothetical protein
MIPTALVAKATLKSCGETPWMSCSTNGEPEM